MAIAILFISPHPRIAWHLLTRHKGTGFDLLFCQVSPHIWHAFLALEPFLPGGSFADPSLTARGALLVSAFLYMGLEGCLYAKNNQPKPVWMLLHPDRFWFLLLFWNFLTLIP